MALIHGCACCGRELERFPSIKAKLTSEANSPGLKPRFFGDSQSLHSAPSSAPSSAARSQFTRVNSRSSSGSPKDAYSMHLTSLFNGTAMLKAPQESCAAPRLPQRQGTF